MAKTVNYTPEMEKEIRMAFEDTETSHPEIVQQLAESFGKTVASVRQKAVRMSLYKKAEYKTKNGKVAESKEELVGKIAEALEINVEVAESLVKANKAILEKLVDTLTES